jgi:hypothetical protein
MCVAELGAVPIEVLSPGRVHGRVIGHKVEHQRELQAVQCLAQRGQICVAAQLVIRAVLRHGVGRACRLRVNNHI